MGARQAYFVLISAMLWFVALAASPSSHPAVGGKGQSSKTGLSSSPKTGGSSSTGGATSGTSTKPLIAASNDMQGIICKQCAEICEGLEECLEGLCAEIDHWCETFKDGSEQCYKPFTCPIASSNIGDVSPE